MFNNEHYLLACDTPLETYIICTMLYFYSLFSHETGVAREIIC